MAGSVNQVCLVGCLGRDPEIKSFSNGGKICNIRLATSESWRDKTSGERKEATEWHSVVIQNENLIKLCEQYIHKGDMIFVQGKLKTRKWQDQSGVDKYTTEVVLGTFDAKLVILHSKKDGGSDGQRSSHAERPASSSDDLDDSIPF